MKTLDTIKEELKEAKLLIGKRVTVGGESAYSDLPNRYAHIVEKVYLTVEKEVTDCATIEEAFDNDGYAICLDGGGAGVTVYGYHREVQENTLDLNDEYTAVISKRGVKVGCQFFKKEKILKLAEMLKNFK